jgi:hypothetical protein
MNSINRLHLYLLFGLWLLVHIFLFYYPGVRSNLYDAKGYVTSADFFLAHGSFEVFHQIFYAVPILLIAFFKVIPGGGIIGFILFQCFLSGVAALCLYRAASILFKDHIAGLTSAAIFICWWDVIQWNTAVMTESIACSLTCLVILNLVVFRDTIKDYAILILLLMLGILTRPTGVLAVFGTFTFLAVRHWHFFASRPYGRILLLTVFALIGFLGVTFMFHHWDLTEQYSKGNIITYMDTIEGQILYHENLRLDTSDLVLPDPERPPLLKMLYFIWHNPIHFGTAAVLKVFYLVTGTRPYFSLMHNAYAVVWLSLIYTLFFFGFFRAGDKATKYFCVAIVVANCLLIAVATVDWDNRFYVPMQPAIALLAGGGGAYFIQYLMLGKAKILV